MNTISFVVPAYNESARIEKTLGEIVAVIKDFKLIDSEIIIIDDNSSDNTPVIINNIKKNYNEISIVYYKNPKNLGFGGSVKKGLKMAKNEKIIWIPGDNSHPRTEINKIIQENHLDLDVISTYYINTRDRAFFRRIFTTLYTPLLNILFGLKL